MLNLFSKGENFVGCNGYFCPENFILMNPILQNIFFILSAVTVAGIGYLIKEVLALKHMLKTANPESKRLQLQAYERLAVLAERMGLKNLISRADVHGESAAIMHGVLIENIKSEYDYNASQQVYVSKEVWDAITRLKDQNIYVINQLAAMLPVQANSLDLSKRILEYTMTQNPELNKIVLDAIQHEAKEIMK